MRRFPGGESANAKGGHRIRRFRQTFDQRVDGNDQPEPADAQRGR